MQYTACKVNETNQFRALIVVLHTKMYNLSHTNKTSCMSLTFHQGDGDQLAFFKTRCLFFIICFKCYERCTSLKQAVVFPVNFSQFIFASKDCEQIDGL